MNRIDQKFQELKNANQKALIGFITAGDPDLETTEKLVLALEKSGADIVEFGIPYSDPIAEGPVIQEANLRALKHDLKVKDIMETVRRLRAKTQVPLAYLLYVNIILQYGPDRFFHDCREVGVDGLIIPDLPFEEKGELRGYADKYGVHIISLVAPNSGERAERIAKDAKGFLYCVSSLGVTGIRKSFATDFGRFFDRLNMASDVPKAIGFGISTPEHIRMLKNYSDGLIVGSAIVKIVGESPYDDIVKNVAFFVRGLKDAFGSEEGKI